MAMRVAALLLTLLSGSMAAQGVADGRFPTVEEALALAFPECRIERSTEFLTEAELERVHELAGCEAGTRVARPYLATRDGKPAGTAWIDAHRVRTKKEVLMIVLDPQDRITRVEVLAFAEPLDYLPRGSFYAQFQGKRQGDPLEIGRGVRGVAGATLSAQAASEAARRTLAVQRVLRERPEPAPSGAR
jgi:hypothetical protein